jgi:hypothetical protein
MIDFLQDLWGFMRERKKFWLAPIILVMVLLGALIIVAQGSAVGQRRSWEKRRPVYFHP